MSPIDNEPATDIVVPNSGQAPAAANVPAGSAPATTDTPQEVPPDASPPETKFQKSAHARLTRQRTDAERRAYAAESKAAALEARIQALESSTAAKSADLRPSDFPNYDAFVEAKIDQRVEAKTSEKLKAVTSSSAEQEASRVATEAWNSIKADEEAEAVDLDAVFETLAQDHVPFTQRVLDLVAEADHPARLAEYLAENPGELDRVSRLGPAMAERALAKMQATFGKLKSKPNATDVPEPPPKMGGRGATPVDPEKINDMAEYKARVFDPRYAKR